jgi:predicted aspartyl protease
MKVIAFALLLIAVTGCSRSEVRQSPPELIDQFNALYESHNFFLLKKYLELNLTRISDDHRMLYQGVVDNAFFDPVRSNRVLDSLIALHGNDLPQREQFILHKTLRANYFNMYAYSDALRENTLILNEYANFLDSAAKDDLMNDEKILQVLKHVPPQQLIKHNDCLIKLSINSNGLTSAPVDFGERTSQLLFDTGFSMSSLKRSLADTLGLEIKETGFYVHGATGRKVKCGIAIVPEIRISEITVSNVVFYVFDDEDLALPEHHMAINGVIGFPVIRDMEEIQIKRNEMIFIPKTTLKYDLNNLALNELDPVIAISYRQDTLPFYLDTGSSFSALYRPYYDRYKTEIDSMYEPRKFMIGSIGGYRKINCYKTDTNTFYVNDAPVELVYTPIFTEYIFPAHMRVAGVIGQDFLSGFDTMIFSFRDASLVLK